jgi:hypothetical protein
LTIYEKTLALSKPYLGPAAENFISRQCKSHLKTEAPLLMASQLGELAKWVAIGAELIMDKGKAMELSGKIAALR